MSEIHNERCIWVCKRVAVSREFLIEYYVNQNRTSEYCARIIGCSAPTIRSALRRHGIPIRPAGVARVELTLEWINEYYIKRKLTITECSKLANCGNTTFHRALKKHNIPTRPAGMPLTDISEDQLRECYCKNRLTIRECASLLHSSDGTVRRAMSLYNIEPHQIGSGPMHPMYGRRGPKCPAWKGGVSFEPYCEKWTEELRESVREAFGRKCYLCPKTEADTGKKLDVHHCDFNKQQGCKGNSAWKLVPLCASCHAKTTNNRHWAFMLLANYWAYKYIDDFTFYAGDFNGNPRTC